VGRLLRKKWELQGPRQHIFWERELCTPRNSAHNAVIITIAVPNKRENWNSTCQHSFWPQINYSQTVKWTLQWTGTSRSKCYTSSLVCTSLPSLIQVLWGISNNKTQRPLPFSLYSTRCLRNTSLSYSCIQKSASTGSFFFPCFAAVQPFLGLIWKFWRTQKTSALVGNRSRIPWSSNSFTEQMKPKIKDYLENGRFYTIQ